MEFIRYHHVEKLGHPDTEEILEGVCSIYPKLDGTNSSVWVENSEVQAGSRNRKLSLDNDNAGFLAWVRTQDSFKKFFTYHPQLKLYGEWLVPHTLKTYREDSWRRLWVFDVFDITKSILIPAEDFASVFDELGIDYIEPIAKINHPTMEQLTRIMKETNTFLIEDNAGVGEGIVIKRYNGYTNKFNKQSWAKMVRNEFKESNKKAFGLKVTDGQKSVEVDIVQEFISDSLVKKELAKIVHTLANNQPNSIAGSGTEEVLAFFNDVMYRNRDKIIPELFGRIYYCLITEEAWTFIKKNRNPIVDFSKLNRLVVQRVKELAPELF